MHISGHPTPDPLPNKRLDGTKVCRGKKVDPFSVEKTGPRQSTVPPV